MKESKSKRESLILGPDGSPIHTAPELQRVKAASRWTAKKWGLATALVAAVAALLGNIKTIHDTIFPPSKALSRLNAHELEVVARENEDSIDACLATSRNRYAAIDFVLTGTPIGITVRADSSRSKEFGMARPVVSQKELDNYSAPQMTVSNEANCAADVIRAAVVPYKIEGVSGFVLPYLPKGARLAVEVSTEENKLCRFKDPKDCAAKAFAIAIFNRSSLAEKNIRVRLILSGVGKLSNEILNNPAVRQEFAPLNTWGFVSPVSELHRNFHNDTLEYTFSIPQVNPDQKSIYRVWYSMQNFLD